MSVANPNVKLPIINVQELLKKLEQKGFDVELFISTLLQKIKNREAGVIALDFF